MNGVETTPDYLIGIHLKSDGYIFQSDYHLLNDNVIIGSIVCSDLSLSCSVFRQMLCTNISSLPQDFRFLSKNGWPIERNDEGKVEIFQLILDRTITIQKYFELPRLGIKCLDEKYVGFIFVNFNSSLSDVRNIIHEDLSSEFHGIDFEFFEKNQWPVSRTQEKKLTVWDICINNFCIIKKLPFGNDLETQNHQTKKRPSKLNNKPYKKRTSSKHYRTNSILISYVHCEATMHARNLKAELQNLGLDSVFLDIDDIPPGQDWQDVINDALNDCTAFVALVTPRYGETKWTNREAKLADDKEKRIIPVSFLEKWPPDQLAIQFLSLQYIPWKTSEEKDEDSVSDITSWDQRCVHRVAKEIKKICFQQDVSTPDSLSLLDGRPQLESGSAPSYCPKSSGQVRDQIVISAHSEQKEFVERIMHILTETGYGVWSSIEMANFCGDIDFLCDNSQTQDSPVFDSYSHDKVFSTCNLLTSKECSTSYPYFKSSSSSEKNSLEYENLMNLKFYFKRKVKESNLVLVIMSEDYNASPICLQQAFYCEQRKDVLVIKYGDFQVNNTILNLYPEQDMMFISGPEDEASLLPTLKVEIENILLEDTSRKSYKDRVQKMVAKLSSELRIEACVYVIGGTSGVSKNAEQFCIHLGTELAKLPSLTLVTEGFFGAGDLVGRNFCEEKEIRAKGQPHSIYHIIPIKDRNITSKRARQTDEGYFEKIPYGQTLFYGDSVAERDDIVSSTFKICLLIEGGERSACLAEKFLWNDCIVIPILFNNGAISSKHCLSESLSKVPSGVLPSDWNLLKDYSTPDVLAKTAKKVVYALLKARKVPSKVGISANKTKS